VVGAGPELPLGPIVVGAGPVVAVGPGAVVTGPVPPVGPEVVLEPVAGAAEVVDDTELLDVVSVVVGVSTDEVEPHPKKKNALHALPTNNRTLFMCFRPVLEIERGLCEAPAC
jgi:hypothetical protein